MQAEDGRKIKEREELTIARFAAINGQRCGNGMPGWCRLRGFVFAERPSEG